MRILIAAGNETDRSSLKAAMASLGTVFTGGDGFRTVEIFKDAWDQAFPYDLICLGIDLPDRDGRHVLAEIRRLEEEMEISVSSRAKIIMIGPQVREEEVLSLMKLGCDDYIVHPLDRDKIEMKVRDLFTDSW